MAGRLVIAALAACLLAACATGAPTAGPNRAAMTTGEHRPTLNGARLWYRSAGVPGAIPTVFLAGGPGGNSAEFAAIAGPAMERRNAMIYFDQRGTGRSERPESGDYRLETLVADIEALRVHLGVPRINLVAHSFGGILALEYAARYPAGVAAIVLAAPAWNAPLSCRERLGHLRTAAPDAHARLMAAGNPPDDAVCDAIFRAVGGKGWESYNNASMFPRPASLERQRAAVSASGLENTGEMQRALFAAGLLKYRFAAPDRVTAPVLIIAGDSDYAVGPATQRTLADLLPDGRITTYRNAGHWLFIDEPERFARDASAFFAQPR